MRPNDIQVCLATLRCTPLVTVDIFVEVIPGTSSLRTRHVCLAVYYQDPNWEVFAMQLAS